MFHFLASTFPLMIGLSMQYRINQAKIEQNQPFDDNSNDYEPRKIASPFTYLKFLSYYFVFRDLQAGLSSFDLLKQMLMLDYVYDGMSRGLVNACEQ